MKKAVQVTLTPVETKLMTMARTRIQELKVRLKATTKREEVTSLQLAIATNCDWLLSLGLSLNDIPEMKEV